MLICDLCESKNDVSRCVIQLPLVREAVTHGDLCAGCQRDVHDFLKQRRAECVKPEPVAVTPVEKPPMAEPVDGVGSRRELRAKK